VTTVVSGFLNIRDSQAIGPYGGHNQTVVASRATLELQVDTGLDPHGRNLSVDSITSTTGLRVNQPLDLEGSGVGGVGALHSISGINQWVGNITLGGLGAADAGIGVDSEEDNGQPSSLTDLYFTNDYSLTVSGDIAGIRSTTFHKE